MRMAAVASRTCGVIFASVTLFVLCRPHNPFRFELMQSDPSVKPGQVMAHINSICNTTAVPLNQALTPACVATKIKSLTATFPNVKFAHISVRSLVAIPGVAG